MSEVKITKEYLDKLQELISQGFEVTRHEAEGKGMVFFISKNQSTTIMPEEDLIKNLKS